jgi:hypothetical protein
VVTFLPVALNEVQNFLSFAFALHSQATMEQTKRNLEAGLSLVSKMQQGATASSMPTQDEDDQEPDNDHDGKMTTAIGHRLQQYCNQATINVHECNCTRMIAST